jgi:hypothetical protein
MKRTKAYESGQLQIFDPKLLTFAKLRYYPIIQWVGALENPGEGWTARVYFTHAFYETPLNIKARRRSGVERQLNKIARERCQYIEI